MSEAESPNKAATPTRPLSGQALTTEIAAAAWEKRANHLLVLDVGQLVSYTDYLVICSGHSDRQVEAIARSITESLKLDHHTPPNHVEGAGSGSWIIIDYVDVVVHVFYEPVRAYYELEKLWSDAPRLPLEEPIWIREHEPMDD